MAENIGMAIRAMVNCGFTRLRLIQPRCGWPNQKAHLASAEKSDLVNVESFDTLKRAIADLNCVFATTARTRDMINELHTPSSAASRIAHFSSNANVGIVFGPESSGLTNEDVSLCNGVISIPSVDFQSYNLAQAVLIICYTLQFGYLANDVETHLGKTKLATLDEINCIVDFLDSKLSQKGYFKCNKRHEMMMQTLRNFFMHSSVTTQEINSLFGALKCLNKTML